MYFLLKLYYFLTVEFLIKILLNSLPCAAGENFEIASISIEKTPIFQKFGAAICLEYA